MTSKTVVGLKRRFGRHLDRIARAVRRFRRLPLVKRHRIERDLMKDLKRETNVIARLDKRYNRLAKAA